MSIDEYCVNVGYAKANSSKPDESRAMKFFPCSINPPRPRRGWERNIDQRERMYYTDDLMLIPYPQAGEGCYSLQVRCPNCFRWFASLDEHAWKIVKQEFGVVLELTPSIDIPNHAGRNRKACAWHGWFRGGKLVK